MNHRCRYLLVLLLIILQPRAGGSIIQGAGLIALMKSSEYVVHGVVEDVSAVEGARGRSMLGRVRVSEIIKGKGSPTHLEMRFKGRMTKDRMVPLTENDAVVNPADEIVIFLSRDRSGDLIPTMGIEGKFMVTRDADGRGMVTSPLGVIPISCKDPEDRPSEMPLSEFLGLLREYATYPQ